jgi:2-methylaconitate cis-trans-isomerase PrpF
VKTHSVPVTIMRAGTSRGLFIDSRDLPIDRDAAILRLFGSPDPRQIDGLGGADLLTSKVAILGPPTIDDADIDYTFGQVGIDSPVVDYRGNCGNISVGVGPYAVRHGFVKAVGDTQVVRIHNTNTGKLLLAHVPVRDGLVNEAGDIHIDGVPGSGAGILMDFSRTAGTATGAVLPTGQPCQPVDMGGRGSLEISVVDFANPVVYVRARDIGLTGVESPDWFRQRPDLMDLIETIRGHGAVLCGMASVADRAALESPTFPNVSLISEPTTFSAITDARTVSSSEFDVSGRIFAMRLPHRSYAGTGLTNLAAAATIPGTLVNQVVAIAPGESRELRVGHPCGVATVQVRTAADGSIAEIGYVRTARLIMEGQAFID